MENRQRSNGKTVFAGLDWKKQKQSLALSFHGMKLRSAALFFISLFLPFIVR